MQAANLLRLLQLSSPTLPIGAYAYSQGAESAVNTKLVHDYDSAYLWLQTVLEQSVACNDMALLVQAYAAWQLADDARIKELSMLSRALRETAELKQEDGHLAVALLRLAEPLGMSAPDYLKKIASYPIVFALFCQAWKVPLEEALTAFAWSWLENQLAAMIKLVPLGQTQGQKLMIELDQSLLKAKTTAMQLPVEQIGSSLPNLAILSSQHENQYSRLFRS